MSVARMTTKLVLVWMILAGVGPLSAAGTGSSGGGSAGSPTAQDWYDEGLSKEEAGNYQDALKDFSQAVALNPGYAEAYNMLGYCTRKLGRTTEAFSYYEKALKLKPNFPEAREYYGEAFLQSGDLAGAVRQYIILQKTSGNQARELLGKIEKFLNP